MQIPQGKQLVETKTGEVVQNYGQIVDKALPGRKDAIANIFSEGSDTPIHIRKATELAKSPKEVQSYMGVEPLTVKGNYEGKYIEIIGAVVWFSGGFEENNDEKKWNDGYHTLLLKITETRHRELIVKVGDKSKIIEWDENVVLKCSGRGIAEYMQEVMKMYGWYDFSGGFKLTGVIQLGTDGKFYFTPISEDMLK